MGVVRDWRLEGENGGFSRAGQWVAGSLKFRPSSDFSFL